jgi:hypothetical protein
MTSPQDEALCPVRALANWIQACGSEDCSGYVFRAPGSNGKAPAAFQAKPIVSHLVVLTWPTEFDMPLELICIPRSVQEQFA